MKEKILNFLIKKFANTNKISDGYHTFEELYDFRLALTAHVFYHWDLVRLQRVLAGNHSNYLVCKSKKHSDGNVPFDGGWFIVCAETPAGQISFHYELKDWHLFLIPELEMAPEWDGHTSEQALERLFKLIDLNKKLFGLDKLFKENEKI